MSLTKDRGAGTRPRGKGDADRSARVARRRFLRRQWARRWLAWRRLLVALVLTLLVAGGVWLVYFSSVLAVSGVQVHGTSVLSPSAVRRAAAVPTGTPLATVDLGSIGARLRRLPAVRSVDVSRAWPSSVRVDVVERRAVAVVEPASPGGRLQGIDASGVLFRSYPVRPRHLPVIRSEPGAGSAALAEAATVAGSLPPALADRVSYVRVRTVDRITLQLRGGHSVLWGSASASADKARVLTVLLAQKASSYDVSVPGQPTITK